MLQGTAAFCAAHLAGAQDQPTFTTEVKVVNVLATVRNKTGALIGNLEKDDFALSEDGRPQAIKYFQHESNLPLILGLMVDTSGSQGKVLDQERAASLRFLDHVFRDHIDHAFIMQFDTSVQVRQGLTGSIKNLDEAMAFVDSETRRQIRMQGGAGTLLYDAVVRAASEIMSKQTGRKALIVLTDGVDFGSDASLSDSVEAAQRADTLIYSILYSDSAYYGPLGGGREGRKVLRHMCDDSGGSFYEVSKKQPIDSIFALLEEELRNQYSLGYTSDNAEASTGYRKIKLRTKEKDQIVQTRDGYYPGP